MQTILSSSTLPAVAAGVLAPVVKQHRGPLEYMFERIKLNLVSLNAHDVYSLCTTAFHSDTIGMLQDADFMRGIADAFARCDQSLLNPFQNSLIADTLRRAGINVSPTSLSIPQQDAISPAALLNVLRSMSVTRTRDERKIEQVVKLLIPIMDECTQVELVMFVSLLSQMKWANADVLVRLTKRAIEQNEQDLATADISLLTKSLALMKGVPFMLHRRMMSLIERRLDDFQPQDYLNVLKGLQALGPRYCSMFGKVVEAGLENVQGMDSLTLTHFLICFTQLQYRNREHIEIYADALVDVAHELRAIDLVQAFIALQRLNLLSESMFITMLNCFMPYVNSLQTRFIAPVIEVCSVVPHSSQQIMTPLLNRIMDCVRLLTPNECGEIIDAIALYPPAKEHAVIQFLGRQAHLRMQIMSTNSVAKATRGLAYLGYNDPQFYTFAAQQGFRYGLKNWPTLEPILMGLCLSNNCSISVVKIAVSHLQHIARSLTLNEVQRAYQYLTKLHCEEDFIYRVLATRALQFVKQITPDMPQDLQALLQRGAVTTTATGA